MSHQPVLLQEVLTALALKPAGVYVDATFGRGGHTAQVLQQLGPEGRVIAIDKDISAVLAAKARFAGDTRFSVAHCSFAKLHSVLQAQGVVGMVDGILMDLGVSSPQLDEAERGFSFLKDGPLDMRMDPGEGISAAEWVNTASPQEIADVLKTFGEERFAKRIAGAIVREREDAPIETTLRLADIVSRANPAWEKHKHPATRSFQAIRIFINKELDDLTVGLAQAIDCLNIGGRLAVISFHSLEDRLVKRFMRDMAAGEAIPKHIPLRAHELKPPRLRRVGKAIRPTATEVAENVRARSAVLRIAEKVS